LERTEKPRDHGLVESDLTGAVIGAAIDVHRRLGPGLLESTYEACLCYELAARQVPFRRQVPVPVVYDDVKLDCGYRVDIVAGSQLVVELKSVAAIEPIHEAQLLTYMRLGGWRLGLLINFNVMLLKSGIRRRILSATFSASSASSAVEKISPRAPHQDD
jgi:GxxExxY protein